MKITETKKGRHTNNMTAAFGRRTLAPESRDTSYTKTFREKLTSTQHLCLLQANITLVTVQHVFHSVLTTLLLPSRTKLYSTMLSTSF